MKYRKPQKLNSNVLSKPYCKHILFSKNSQKNIHTEDYNTYTKRNSTNTFISPVHKNNYIYSPSEKHNNISSFPSNTTQEDTRIKKTNTNTEREKTVDIINNITINNKDNTLQKEQFKADTESEHDKVNMIVHNMNCQKERESEINKTRHYKTKSEIKESMKNGLNTNIYKSKQNLNKDDNIIHINTKDKTLRNTLINHESEILIDDNLNSTTSNIIRYKQSHLLNKQIPTQSLEQSRSLKYFHTFSEDIVNNNLVKEENSSNANNNSIINFQEILEIQIKLNHILLKIENYSTPNIEIFSWWNYYYKSSLISTYVTLFNDVNNKKAIDMFFKIEALISILCYDISHYNNKFEKARIILKSIYSLIHFNFLIFIKFLLVKFKDVSDVFTEKLNSIIKMELSNNIYNRDMKELFVIELLRHNNKSICGFYMKLIEMFYTNNGELSGEKGKNSYKGETMKCNGGNYSDRGREKNCFNKEEIISKFFVNAFNSINSYTYSDYNTFIKNYLNKEDDSTLTPLKVNEKETNTETKNDNQTISGKLSRNIRNEFRNANSIGVDINNSSQILNKHRHFMSSGSASSIHSKNINYTDYITTNPSSTKSSLTQRNPLTQSCTLYSTNPNHQRLKKIISFKTPYQHQSPSYFLPPISKEYEYTLILDLDETLVHVIMDKTKQQSTQNQAKIIYRPLLFEFLRKMKHLYEMIIFTVSHEDYANKVIDCIEKKEKYFAYKLYRQHVTFIGGEYYKDLSRIGRDLRKVIVVDNMPQNFALQKENGICIRAFYGKCNEDNNILNELGDILERIRFDTKEDIRETLLLYKDRIRERVTEVGI